MDRIEAVKHLKQKQAEEGDYNMVCALQMAIIALEEEELRVVDTRGWK